MFDDIEDTDDILSEIVETELFCDVFDEYF